MDKNLYDIDLLNTCPISGQGLFSTVKPVCNDHLYDKIYYLWFIQ